MERCLHGVPGLPGLAAPLPGRWSDVVHKGKQGRTQAHLLQDQEELTNCKRRHSYFLFSLLSKFWKLFLLPPGLLWVFLLKLLALRVALLQPMSLFVHKLHFLQNQARSS